MQSPDDLAAWLTVEQAALAYHKSTRTIRRLLAEGQIRAQKVEGPRGWEWRVQPPVNAPTSAPDGPTDPPAPPPAPSTAMIPLSDVEHLLAPVVQMRDELRSERDALRAQLDQVQDARRSDATEIGRLQGRLETLEAELARLRDRSPPAPPDPPRRRRWPWERR